MKKLSIALAVVGLILLIGSNFLYKKESNPMDTAGTRVVTKTLNGDWSAKIPVFLGAVMIGLGAIFYVASQSRVGNKGNAV